MACARPETKPEQVFPQGALPSISVTIFYVHLGTRYLHQLALTVIQVLAIIHEPGAVNTHLPAISVFPQESSAQPQRWGFCFLPNFPAGLTEACRGQVTRPRPRSQLLSQHRIPGAAGLGDICSSRWAVRLPSELSGGVHDTYRPRESSALASSSMMLRKEGKWAGGSAVGMLQ